MRKSKKSVVLISVLCVLVLLCSMGAGCSQPQSQPAGNGVGVTGQDEAAQGDESNQERVSINLRLAHFWPATHPAEVVLVQGWAKLMNEVTDGQITVTSFPGETLLASAEIYDGVQTGIADIGMSCFSYTRGRFPLLEVFELPGIIYNNSKVASKVAWEGIKELNPAEVQDTKLLMVLCTGPGALFTKVPVHQLEDIKHMTIRATGLSAKTLEALGAIPVAMPQADAYEALSKGVVQANMSPLEVLEGWRHAEVTDYVIIAPFLYNTLFFMTINLDSWNKIPAHLQDVMLEATEKFYDETCIGLWDMQNDSGIEFAIRETGQQVIELSGEEQARWIEIIEPIQDEFVDSMAKLGLDGAEALQLTKDLADRYNEIYQ